MLLGPTFEEMLNPRKISKAIRSRAVKMAKKDPLDPINLFNISWKDENDRIRMFVVPPAITGVRANIVVLFGRNFPTGSHKVGATYSILAEKQLERQVNPSRHTLVWPSTGNYGIGGAWVGCRMNYDCVVILPEQMSQERFDMIEKFGARVIATPGCESNVKEIYDKCHELTKNDPQKIRVLNQFSEFGNYRFHYFVTGNTIVEAVKELKKKKIGSGKVSAFISAMGSSGTIAAGDRLKQVFSDALVVGVEPVQCPTVSLNGYGGHDIQGIGDKHVTWIHNVMNTDAMVCIDDMESKLGLQLLTDPVGQKFLSKNLGISQGGVERLASVFGISGVCNLLAAIKTAKYYDMTEKDTLFTVCTDSIERYHSVMKDLSSQFGKMTEKEAYARYKSIFQGVKLDYLFEGTYQRRKRWHNLKYYTWVEQQGKSVEELNAQMSAEYWEREQAKVTKINEKIKKNRDLKSF